MPVERRFEPSSQSPALDAALDKVAEKLRADPQTFERARAFARLRDELHLDEEEIARRVGVHKSVVSRLLALLKQPEETQKPAADESNDPLHSPVAVVASKPSPVAAQPTIEDVPPWEIERRMQVSGMLTRQSPTLEQKIASWCITVSSLVRGPLRNAVWEFYERMTEAATWWRMLKAVGKVFARFIPRREPEPTKMQKAIKECFSFLHEPSEPKSPPKKPDADPPKAA